MDKELIKKDFIEMYTKYIQRQGADRLLLYMKYAGFFEAPASTKYHGSYEGGLARHSLNVMHRLNTPEVRNEYSMETCAICGLLHDLCKIDCYEKTGKGKFEYRTGYPIGHGEKSIILIQEYMQLTKGEIIAIRWHMGGFDQAVRGGCRDINAAYEKNKLAVWLHVADMLATYIDEPIYP